MEFVLAVAALIAAWLVASTAVKALAMVAEVGTPPPEGADRLGRYHLAYLAGGPRRVVNAAISELVAREFVRVSRGGRVSRVSGSGAPGLEPPDLEAVDLEAVEQAVLDRAGTPGGEGAAEIRHAVGQSSEMAEIKLRLIAGGALAPDGALSRPRRLNTQLASYAVTAFSVMVVTLLVAFADLVPWSVPTVAVVAVAGATGLFGFAVYLRNTRVLSSPVTPAGRAALRKAMARTPRAPRAIAASGAYAGFAVALYGLGSMSDQAVAAEIDQVGVLREKPDYNSCAAGSCGSGAFYSGDGGHVGGHAIGNVGGCGGGSSCGGGCGGGGCGGGN
ncbi:hypothetical protein Pth03_13580 [Planotetraspora thailandica]|uniref:TIGR04222 domain-containing membrane protein n=1 Tax=Planotetraspora thailandica TaxID=487172 RepID=A0A8J3XU81_9ACTN|nr:TIGR04222 domain-containing membrane protein [Planotetraspora thailandica]GII52969.1 hypothetical protein Pth03_13580 [Planotetraspora thailandica]